MMRHNLASSNTRNMRIVFSRHKTDSKPHQPRDARKGAVMTPPPASIRPFITGRQKISVVSSGGKRIPLTYTKHRKRGKAQT
ncbi:hypothetical protein E2C01_038822 [Portunus trituberculatus]|uniref:Uncharacterized protein n=1 Tax=Portunus trituberculatus TaxID=210409 RepID=A0A5B7FHX9_PORTR|nr:hypothetical protein [Portunus trituberculatus]